MRYPSVAGLFTISIKDNLENTASSFAAAFLHIVWYSLASDVAVINPFGLSGMTRGIGHLSPKSADMSIDVAWLVWSSSVQYGVNG